MKRRAISNHPEAPRLTDRQLEIWRRLVAGQSGKWMACEMGMTDAAISNHKTRLLANIGATSNEDAVRIAVRWGVGKREAVA